MCLEFALKRGGIGIMKNFMFGTRTVLNSLPNTAKKRFSIGF